jgi:hypothetical protein
MNLRAVLQLTSDGAAQMMEAEPPPPHLKQYTTSKTGDGELMPASADELKQHTATLASGHHLLGEGGGKTAGGSSRLDPSRAPYQPLASCLVIHSGTVPLHPLDNPRRMRRCRQSIVAGEAGGAPRKRSAARLLPQRVLMKLLAGPGRGEPQA